MASLDVSADRISLVLHAAPGEQFTPAAIDVFVNDLERVARMARATDEKTPKSSTWQIVVQDGPTIKYSHEGWF
jgi:hypothetical protein